MAQHKIVKIVFILVALAFTAFATTNVANYYGCCGQQESAEQSD